MALTCAEVPEQAIDLVHGKGHTINKHAAGKGHCWVGEYGPWDVLERKTPYVTSLEHPNLLPAASSCLPLRCLNLGVNSSLLERALELKDPQTPAPAMRRRIHHHEFKLSRDGRDHGHELFLFLRLC
jgi:hypothetical protein